jgi:hypothetical protein
MGQVCHHLSFRPMDLTFSDRSTKVLTRIAAISSAYHWTPGTIDYKPASPRSVAIKIHFRHARKLLFRKAFASLASSAYAVVVHGAVFRFSLATPCLAEPCRMVHRRKTGNLRGGRLLLGTDHAPDRMDLGRSRRVTRPREKDVHFHRGAEWRHELGGNVYPSATEVAAVPVAAMNSTDVVLPGKYHRQPQRVPQRRSALRNWAHRCWSHNHLNASRLRWG